MQPSKTNPEGASRTRAELSATLKDFKDALQKQMIGMASLQKHHFRRY